MLYPNIGVFQVNEFIGMRADPQLVLECVRAYNDFLVDWHDVAPDRYVPLLTVPFWDLDATMVEMRRSAARGHRGIVFPGRMEDFGLPPLSDAHWDPFWAQAQEMGLSINFHIGSGNIPMFGTDNPGQHLGYAWTSSMLFMLNATAITSLVFGGVCQRFPDLKFVSVESGVGWIPFLLEAMDWNFHNSGVAKEHPEFDLLPSEYFARQIYSCFWFEERSARAAIELLGADHVLFETDFPHPTGMTPGPASARSAARAPEARPRRACPTTTSARCSTTTPRRCTASPANRARWRPTVSSIQESLYPELTCFGCGHANPDGFHLRSYVDGDVVVAEFTPWPEHDNGFGFLNGGIISTVLDCHGAAVVMWEAAQQMGGARPARRCRSSPRASTCASCGRRPSGRRCGSREPETVDEAEIVVHSELEFDDKVRATMTATWRRFRPR